MTVRVVSTFMSIWLGFALVGGFVDGVLLGSGDQDALSAALQPEITQERTSGGFFASITGAFGATVDFLTGWANMLALNFSFFAGGRLETMVGWIIRAIIGIPMITMLLIAIFGR